MRRALLALVIATLPATAWAGDLKGLTAKDLGSFDRVSDVRISPLGKTAIYDLRSTDWAKNRGVHSLWELDVAARTPPHRLPISEGGASSGRWSADGKWIYFMSSRSGSPQVWRADADGVMATQITRLPLPVGSFRLAPDGKTLVVAMAVYPDCKTLQCTLDRSKAPKVPSGTVYDRLFVRHWDEWADGTRNHLFALSLTAGEATVGEPIDLMTGFDGDSPSRPFGDETDFTFTADSAAIIFSARVAGRNEPWQTNFDLYKVPLTASTPPINLTVGNLAGDSAPAVSPDGTKLAWLAMRRPGFESDRNALMVRDLKTGATRELAPGWDRSVESFKWSKDGKTIYGTAEDLGQTRIFAFSPAKGGMPSPVTGSGHVLDFDPGKTELIFTQDNLSTPAQVFRLSRSDKAPVQITSHNADRLAQIAMGQAEQFSFAGWNGETVYGYVMKPADYEAGKSYPVAFLIHGGPQGSFGNLFHYRWNAQTYAGHGYAVVMIDFHGSTGYGQGFTDAISQHWGDRPLEDLQKGWTYALAKYAFLDADRACALGGSYGGYMINWIAGNWSKPWKCLVNHDGLFDTHAMGYSTDELWFSEWENGGTPYEHPDSYQAFNPANHVNAWTKPELVIHGRNDFRVPLEQGLGTFTALQRKGVPSQFLDFPDENHWVLKPENGLQWHETVFNWLDRWTAK
ncbi:MAG: peptidase S9 [Phenylobacterium zucineum]|nr:MAG: peptidase S9 [Phenylobacterium zucineum]